MDNWRRKLIDDLTQGFVVREYQAMCPQMTVSFEQDAIHRYRSDSLFHARVDAVVAGVMALVDKHVPTGDKRG